MYRILLSVLFSNLKYVSPKTDTQIFTDNMSSHLIITCPLLPKCLLGHFLNVLFYIHPERKDYI